jgi:cytochrome c oxidase subunit I
VGWLWLATECGAQVRLTQRVTVAFFALGVAPVFFTPAIYLLYPTNTYDNMEMFTRMMRVGGGLAALPIGLAVALAMWRRGFPDAGVRPLFGSLLCSILLFGLGGGISFLIKDSNTIITAHYHATGGAVSVALMGMAYVLLPKLGFSRPNLAVSSWQPYVYGSGQVLHIIGLLWSGGYGVQRKVAGAEQGLHGFAQIAGMGLMGIGGLIAVVGGLMFLWVAFRAMSERRQLTAATVNLH